LGEQWDSPHRDATRRAVIVPPAALQGTIAPFSWSHPGTIAPFSWSHPGTIAPFSWSHPGTIAPFSWSHRGRFHGATRGPGTTPWSHVLRVKEGLWSHPLSWGGDHAWSWDHGARGPPSGPRRGPTPRRGRAASRAATRHRVRPGVRAHGRSRTVTVTRPRRRRPAHRVLNGDHRRHRQHEPLAVLIDRRVVRRRTSVH